MAFFLSLGDKKDAGMFLKAIEKASEDKANPQSSLRLCRTTKMTFFTHAVAKLQCIEDVGDPRITADKGSPVHACFIMLAMAVPDDGAFCCMVVLGDEW